MKNMDIQNMIEIARNLACEAAVETDNVVKLKLLVESANQYRLASENADELGVKISLAYLSAFKVSEANILKTAIGSVDHKVHQIRNLNESAPKEAISFGSRLLLEAHSRRISGLSKVPKPRIISSEDVVKDLLMMEKRLDEIGFFKQTQDQLKSNVGESKHLSSDLGESFMLLSTHQYATNSKSPKTTVSETNRPDSLSTPKSNKVKFKGGNTSTSAIACQLNGIRLEVGQDATDLGKSIILENRTTLSAQHPHDYDEHHTNRLHSNIGGSNKSSKQLIATQYPSDHIEWNSKSMLLPMKPSSQTENKNNKSPIVNLDRKVPLSDSDVLEDASSKLINSTKHSKSDKSLLQSIDSTRVGQTLPIADEILRLLESLRTLHDENVLLLEEKDRVLQEVAAFKEEYKAKFLYMKRYLQQFPQQPLNATGTVDFTKQPGPVSNGSNYNSLPSARELELLKQSTHWKQIAEAYENKYRKIVEENNLKSAQLDEYAAVFQEVKKRKEQQHSHISVNGSNRLDPSTAQFKSTVQQKSSSHTPVTHNTRSSLNNSNASAGSNAGTATVQSMNIATIQAQLRRQKHHATTTLESLQNTK